jgi:hypothetical protein
MIVCKEIENREISLQYLTLKKYVNWYLLDGSDLLSLLTLYYYLHTLYFLIWEQDLCLYTQMKNTYMNLFKISGGVLLHLLIMCIHGSNKMDSTGSFLFQVNSSSSL